MSSTSTTQLLELYAYRYNLIVSIAIIPIYVDLKQDVVTHNKVGSIVQYCVIGSQLGKICDASHLGSTTHINKIGFGAAGPFLDLVDIC